MILRKAAFSELPIIWDILQQAIEQRKQDGSEQWQDGYPNERGILNRALFGKTATDYSLVKTGVS